MKKLVLLATALAMVSGTAHAADMAYKAVKAPPPPAFDPWDIAFGGGITNDYIFRGITQSNHKPSVNVYFEPRYNVTKDFQLYVGVGGASISFPNRAAAEIDAYGGARLTVGQFAFDVGAWGYMYPGGTCQFGAPGIDFAGNFQGAECAANALLNTNVLKKDVSFFEVYGKVNYTFNDNFSMGGNIYYTPSFLNSGAEGTYASIVGKAIAPSTWFGASGIGMYVSGEFGRQWLGTSELVLRRRSVPERHQLRRLQHLEHRYRLHLQGVHAGLPLLRHRPVEGQLQRFHQRLLGPRQPHGIVGYLRDSDQSVGCRFELVRRRRYRQALG